MKLSEVKLLELTTLLPIKFIELENNLLRERNSAEISFDLLSNSNKEKCIEKFGSPKTILIPRENFREHMLEMKQKKEYKVEYFLFVPFIMDDDYFMHVILLNYVSGIIEENTSNKLSMSLRYIYKTEYDPTLKYVDGYTGSCFVMVSEFLAEVKNNSIHNIDLKEWVKRGEQ